MNSTYKISIDGPAGAGKTTVAKEVAKRLNFLFISTGGIFRCYAIALKNTINPNDEVINSILSNSVVTITPTGELLLNGKNVTEEAYDPKIAKAASTIAKKKIVREKALKDQRIIAESNNVVMEGRDIGSVVLPDATLKIFLTASLQNRAIRRANQIDINSSNDDITKIKDQIKSRDHQDTTRKIAPLRKPKGSITINSDNLSINEVTDKIISLFNEKISELNRCKK